jgi:diguanylate cyclase (GGDEF)-like protein
MKQAIGRILLLGVLTCVAPAQALDPQRSFHQYVKDAWSIEQGLPQISVLAIAQDDDGYLWVGTQAGLARFDGVRFVNFTPNDTPEIPGMMVQDLLADTAGRLWIGTYVGLAVRDQGRFRHIARRSPTGDIEQVDVRALAELPDGRIAVSTQLGLHWVEGDRLVPDAILTGVESFALLASGHALLVGGRDAIHRVDHSGIETAAVSFGAPQAAIRHLAADQDRLWAGSNAGLLVAEHGQWRSFRQHPAVAPSAIGAMRADGDGNLWVASHAGLARMRHGDLHEFIEDGEDFAHRSVRAIFEDREGNLWLGSQWQGLARLWNGWVLRYAETEGLHQPVLWSVALAADGSIWAGTHDGLSRFDGRRFHQVLAGSDLPHPNAYTLFAEEEHLWIGTRAGLALYDGHALRSLPPAFAALDGIQINGILRDRDQQLWLATMAGAYRFHDGVLQRFGEAEGLEDSRVRLLLETGDGRLLAGTQRGAYQLVGERFVALGDQSGLPRDIDVTAMLELADGSLVIGTLTEDLFLGDEGSWTRLGSDHGLPVNSPFFMAEDAEGYLWVTGIRGIYRTLVADLHALREGRIDRVHGEMLLNERGDPRSGQKGHCCNGAGLAKGFLHEHALWLPTRSGIVSMPTRGIRTNSVAPRLAVERIRRGGTWTEAEPVSGLALPADQRDLAFEFTALSFQDPESVQIRYRLRGYDRDWQLLPDGDRRSAVYTNLPPGEYVFQVIASNNTGVWAGQPATLAFSIKPHFHETGWFAGLLVAAVAVLVLVLLFLLTRRHERLRLRLQQLVEARTQELQMANRRLEEISQRDALTGLRNRRFLIEQLPADLAYLHRHLEPVGAEGPVMLLAMLDIDGFKLINDRHGHHAGDLILKQLATLLEREIRSGDYAVRWGGEEFLLVLRPMLRSQTTLVIERIRQAIESEAFDIGKARPLRLTCSIGMVEYPLTWDAPRRLGWESLVEIADYAMYRVKRGGRNGWALLRATASTRFDELPDNLATLGDAMIACGELELLHSPGLRLASDSGETLPGPDIAHFRKASCQ